jgi:WD40 repeat protein
MSLSPRVLWRFYRESLLKFGRILVMNTQAKTISFLQYNRKLLLEQYHVSKIALFGSFLFFLFTINIYASSLPNLQMNIHDQDQAIYTPDHKYIISITHNLLRFWQINDLRVLKVVKDWDTHGAKLLISPDSHYLYIAIENYIYIYDLQTLSLISEDNAFIGAVAEHMDFSKDKKSIIIFSRNNGRDYKSTFNLIEKTSLIEQVNDLPKNSSSDEKINLYATNMLHHEYFDLVRGKRNKVFLQGNNCYYGWDFQSGKEIWRNVGEKHFPKDASPSPALVLFNHIDKAIVLPDVASLYDKKETFLNDSFLEFNTNTGLYKQLPIEFFGTPAISNNDKYLAIVSYDGTVRIYDTDTFDLNRTFKGDGGESWFGRAKLKFDSEKNDFFTVPVRYQSIEETDDKYINDLLSVSKAIDYSYIIHNRRNNQNEIARFASFQDGEWLIVTDIGYFNASSKRVLNNLNIFESVTNARRINDEEVKKYYRPDIVSAILQQKPITDLENSGKVFELAEKAEYVNQYYPSLRAMYVKDHNPYGLAILASQKNPDDLKLIKKAIVESNSSDVKSTLYRSLENFDKNETLLFIDEQLDKPSSMNDQVVLLSLIKDIDKSVQKMQKLLSKKALSENSKIWFATWAREEDCQKFEPLLWFAVEKSLRIRNEIVINYLMKKDSKKL